MLPPHARTRAVRPLAGSSPDGTRQAPVGCLAGAARLPGGEGAWPLSPGAPGHPPVAAGFPALRPRVRVRVFKDPRCHRGCRLRHDIRPRLGFASDAAPCRVALLARRTCEGHRRAVSRIEPHADPPTVSPGVRVAWWLFAAHAALIVFSTAAMLTVLTGSVEITGEPAATIMQVSYR